MSNIRPDAEDLHSSSDRLESRRDFVVLGARIGGVVLAGSYLLFFLLQLNHANLSVASTNFGLHFLWALYIALPASIVVGAVIAYRSYGNAFGPKPKDAIRWWVWILFILFFLVLGWVGFFLGIQQYRRDQIFSKSAPIGWKTVAVYGICAIGIMILCHQSVGLVIVGYVYLVIIGFFITDCSIVNALARMQRAGRLAEPPTGRFQFSLGIMQIAVLGMGAYISSLVLLFRYSP